MTSVLIGQPENLSDQKYPAQSSFRKSPGTAPGPGRRGGRPRDAVGHRVCQGLATPPTQSPEVCPSDAGALYREPRPSVSFSMT